MNFTIMGIFILAQLSFSLPPSYSSVQYYTPKGNLKHLDWRNPTLKVALHFSNDTLLYVIISDKFTEKYTGIWHESRPVGSYFS